MSSFVLISCVSPTTSYDAWLGKISGPDNYISEQPDGKPWWDIDVSSVHDAIPYVHVGKFKNEPYTVKGKSYKPLETSGDYMEIGRASWYGTRFHGKKTANGEIYDLYGMSAAHRTLPLPSYVMVTNLDNQRNIIVRVNDRGPFYDDRVIDLSFAAAKKLGFSEIGIANVLIEAIDPKKWWESRSAVPQEFIPEELHKLPNAYVAPKLATVNDTHDKRHVRNIWPISPNNSLKLSKYCNQLFINNEQDDKCTHYLQIL